MAVRAGADPAAAPRERRIAGLAVRHWPRIVAPLLLGAAFLLGWTAIVRWRGIPPYILPEPLLIAKTLVADWQTLSGSLWITMSISLAALSAAVVLGSSSRSSSRSRSGSSCRSSPMR